MKLLLTVCLLFPAAVQAQFLADAARPLGRNFARALPVTTDGRLFTGKNPGVEGTPFLDSNWTAANLLMSDGSVFKDVKARLNIYSNTFHFLDSTGTELYLEAAELKRVEFTEPGQPGTVKATFLVLATEKDGRQSAAFYELLSEGKIKLLQLKRKWLDETLNGYTQEKSRRLVASEGVLYVYTGQTLAAVKKKISFWQELMADKWTEMEKFSAAMENRFHTPAEIQWAVEYYNTLK